MARPAHRVRQFFTALGLAPRSPLDPRRWLGPKEARLFFSQGRADQRHALRVAERLLSLGWNDQLLLRAALLHDVGKAGGRITLAHRVIWVLVGRLAPRLRTWLVRRGSPWGVLASHAAIGAERLRGAGADARLVALVAGHPLPGDEERARLLGEADDAV